MDVDRWHVEGHFGKRVLLDGEDITSRCIFFDDEQGVAECWKVGVDGEPVLTDGDLVFETLHGKIEVRPG